MDARDAITSAKAAEASYIQYTGRMQEFVHLFQLVVYRVFYTWMQKPCEVMMIRHGGNSLARVCCLEESHLEHISCGFGAMDAESCPR